MINVSAINKALYEHGCVNSNLLESIGKLPRVEWNKASKANDDTLANTLESIVFAYKGK